MLTKTECKDKYEIAADGTKAFVSIVKGQKVEKEHLTVTELRDFLNELISEGYGDYNVAADTQDGESYYVRDEVEVFNKCKEIVIF